MAKAVTLQDWQTICGAGTTDVVFQNQDFYVDVSHARKVIVRFDTTQLTNVALSLETSKRSDQKYWRKSLDLATSGTTILTRDQGLTTGYVENYLRFRLEATGAPWSATFRIQLFMK